jgi:PAS domain S-box-containing protein
VKNIRTVWLPLVLSWVLVFALAAGYIFFVEVRDEQRVSAAREMVLAGAGRAVIAKEMEAVGSDLLLLSESRSFFRAFSTDSLSEMTDLEREFLAFARMKQRYFQVRFLDERGKELIKVAYDSGEPMLTPAAQLQNKAGRYYFQESIGLEKGQVYVSPFDLNMEHGALSQPHIPVIRFATPVFDAVGRKRGVLVVNYFGDRLLDNFKFAMADVADQAMLLNSDGFWLSNPDKSREWGFMLGTNHRFSGQFSGAWPQLLESEQGQLRTAKGLFTFDTVYPLRVALGSSTRAGGSLPASENSIALEDRSWKVVSRISQQRLDAMTMATVKRLSLVFGPLYLCFVAGSCWLTYVVVRRRKSEAALAISERRKSLTFSAALDAIITFDSDCKIIEFNPSAEAMFGHRYRNVRGQDVVELIVPQSMRNRFYRGLQRYYETGESYLVGHRIETLVQRRNGEEFYVESFLTPLQVEGTTLITAFVRDVTVRKQQEETLVELHKHGHIVSSATDMLALVNKEYIYEAVNPAYQNASQVPVGDLVGHSLLEVVGEEYFNSELKERIDRCLAGEVVTVDRLYPRPTGGDVYIHAVYSPYVDADGETQGVILSGRDVSGQRRLEEELGQARKLESVGVLAGGIAHDFNNILTGLFGNLELVMEALPQDHTAYNHAQSASQALRRASGLTQQLLVFAKGGEPILDAVNVGQVIQDSIEFTLSGSKVSADCRLPEDLWQVRADNEQFYQVISNLVVNSLQAMPDGGTIYIEAANIGDADERESPYLSGDLVKLTIRDEGNGIPANRIEKIFDPYYTTKTTGRGLGLATVHRIIVKHHGHVSVVSAAGEGTTFTVYIPADKTSPQKVDDNVEPAKASPPTSANILVMDDDQMIRDLSVAMLEAQGYTVDTAVDGEAAIDKYVAARDVGKPVDLVIMDLTIPGGMGGEEAIAKLLALDPKAKAIVSSGYSTGSVMANYKEHGFKDILAKPFQMADLREKIEWVLQQK